MTKTYYCAITENEISLHQAFAYVSDPTHGATTSFVGTIRDFNLGQSVVGVSYDVHEKLAQKVFHTICEEAIAQCQQPLKIYIEHFKGRLSIGGISVVIAVGSMHRHEAFTACRFIIEAVKHRCPIWKQEHYANGNSEWVKGHELCAQH